MTNKNHFYFSVKAICFVLTFLATGLLYSQGEAANWYFGRGAGVNFSNGTANALVDGAIQTDEGSSSISNSKGELLFYTDGILVWDRNHNIMLNGSNLLGNESSTQSALIVPKPNSETIYYIFTVSKHGSSDGVRYSEVDMTLNNGNGDVTSNKNIFLTGSSAEKISAVKHADGKGYWIATHEWNSNEFSMFNVTETGVNSTPVKSTVGSYHGNINFNSIGYMKFSPNGKRLALAKWSTDSTVEIFDFDSSTGIISNPIILDNYFRKDYLNGAYGIGFSPNSNLLYVSEIDLQRYESQLHQFNLEVYNKTAVINSDIIVYSGRNLIAAIQLALDDKLYVCNPFSRYISAIQNPNIIGLGCNYLEREINLSGRFGVFGLPSQIQSLFVAKIENDNMCLGGDTHFSIKTDEPIDDVLWDFGDSETSTEKTPTHDYSAAGTYTVKAKIKSGNCILNIKKEVIIYESPTAYKAKDYVICEDKNKDGFESFNLKSKTIEILESQSDTDFQVTYFATFDDADNNLNELSSDLTNKVNYQEIYGRVSNRLNPECYDISKFLLIVETAIAGDIDDIILCVKSEIGSFVLDLNQYDGAVYSQTIVTPHSNYEITYYLSQLNADIAKDELTSKNFTTKTNHEISIYARLENTETGCFTTTSFKVIINEVKAYKPSDMFLCDDSLNDNKEVFDLSSQVSDILQSQTRKVTFHKSSSDADLGLNAINENFENETISQEIYVRVENLNDSSCYDTTSFFIEVNTLPIAGDVENLILCDDSSNDGIAGVDLTQFDTQVYNGFSESDHQVSYYLTELEAESGSGTSLSNNFTTKSNNQDIYVRLENNATSCFTTTHFKIIINEMPKAHQPSNMFLCDDSSNDGKEVFDLASQVSDILESQTRKVTFHRSSSDADLGLNAINENFENERISQEIYVRVENSNDLSCYDTTSFSIKVNTLPIAGQVENLILCDDSSNDGIAGVDLTQFDTQIYNGFSESDHQVSYYLTELEAESGSGTSLSNNFTTKSNNQDIYVRLENDATGCFTTTHFQIIINEMPITYQPSNMYLCDDSSNDGKELFDLASQVSDILESQTRKVTFHKSSSDADLGLNAINENFENETISQEIYVRVENLNDSSCYDTTSFFIEVNTLPIAGDVENLILCDDSSNDGIAGVDLTQFNTQIYNGFSESDHQVSYYLTELEAESGSGTSLSNNFTTKSNNQDVYVRLENDATGCFTTTHFQIIINEMPIAYQPSNMYLCDDSSNDGKEVFDLASQVSDILQSQTRKVTFHKSSSDADLGLNAIDENFENETISQEIFVRVESLINTSCYDITSFFVEVTNKPFIDVVKKWYLCPGESLELYVDSIHDEYLWSNGKTDSEIIIDKAGTYSVTVYNIDNGNTCSVTETIQVFNTELPKSVKINVTDWTTTNNSIQIDVDGSESYQYSLDDALYQDDNTFSNLEAGDYQVYIKNDKGCLLYTEDVYLLNYPKFFTPNNDSYNDYWKINFSETEPDIKISIFDRYGKLIIQLNALSNGWDGTSNGQTLLTSDYWFVVERPSKNKQYKGHFTLKR